MLNHSESSNNYQRILLFCATSAIIASAFHFWPFSSHTLWKLINLANLSVIVGVSVVFICAILKKDKPNNFFHSLPPLSVWACLVFHLLSCAYADTLSRPVIYTIKMSLMMIGGYILFMQAFQNYRASRLFLTMLSACFICVLSSGYTQYILKDETCGFFENPYKYGTYTAILGVFVLVYIISGKTIWRYILALLLLFAMMLTFRTIGAVASITTGLLVGLFFQWGVSRKSLLSMIFLLAVIGIGLLSNLSIVQDAKLIEKDGQNLRQRYIEWQAEINMLETYGMTGSGAGSINDYRSNYYYRLPKLNTLEPFDQNGWLAISAETGILGLLCFIWIIYEHGRYLFVSRSTLSTQLKRVNVALLAALTTSCVCNVFSSVYYNGVLIAFAVVLALSKSLYYSGRKGHQ